MIVGQSPQDGAESQGSAPRVVSDQEKALSKALQQEIEEALRDRQDDHKRFADNRKLLRGNIPNSDKKLRVNLHFANLAAMRPQVYAKDPEFAVQPTKSVPPERLPAARAFGEACEALLDEMLTQRCHLKKRAKRILTSAYTNAVGWWKLSWQQGRPADPLIQNRLKDSQDNLQRLQQQRAAINDPAAGQDIDRQIAELNETIAGMRTEAERRIGRGLVLDFVMPDDMLVLDRSVFEIQDYARAAKLGQCVWMTCEQYEAAFGYKPDKAKKYASKPKPDQSATDGQRNENGGSQLVRVFEVWDQQSNRVHTVCLGEEGLCRESYSPDWTGERWYPFFLLLWNEIDGAFLPPSDVELTDAVVREYNEAREDLEKDRRDARPFTLARRGGQLTPTDVENIRNRRGNDVILVEAVGNAPLTNDIAPITLGTINPAVYDTAPARSDMEQLVGGGDAARGSVLKAKTATEAEILSQGLRGRSAERTDVIEDLLSEVGVYALEIMLRKLTPEEVQKVAGTDAVWPTVSAEEAFDQVSVRVRGGSTGRPDRLQEQDRWTKLMPVIKDTVKEIVAVRQAGQEQLAQLAMALLKETLRRFDERFEVDQYIPDPDKQEPGAESAQPQIPPELIAQVQEQMAELTQRAEKAEQALKDKQADILAGVERSKAEAWAKVEVARLTAPIQAEADVEAARVKSEAAATAQMHAASLQAQSTAEDERTMQDIEAIRQQLAGVIEFAQGMAEQLQQATAPKPRMKVAHVFGPDGAITESRLVPDEEDD